MRKFFRTTYSLAVIILFLVVAALGFTQTNVFRSYLRSLLVETVASDLHGELSLGSLHGNLFTGFSAENVVLRQNGSPVLSVQHLEATYDPLGLLAKRIAISRIILTKPEIFLARTNAGEWNVGPLFRGSSSDSSPSAWTFALKQVQFKGGTLRLLDSLALSRRTGDSTLTPSAGRIDYSDLQLDSLDIEAVVSVHQRTIGLTIRRLACQLLAPGMEIRNLSGEFQLSPGSAIIRAMDLETRKSHVKLDARLDSIDVTKIHDLAQLRSCPVALRVNAERVDFGELKQFVGQPVKFLDREAACMIDMTGRFGSMDLRNVTLRAGSTVVRTTGTVKNLDSPRDIELDLAFVRNRIDPADLAHLMPGLAMPDLSLLGAVEYDLHFMGKPAAFTLRLASSSQIGDVDVNGALDLRDPLLTYDGTITTRRLNLAPIFHDSLLSSDLRSTITVQGRGTRLTDMTSILRVEIDSSRFYGLPVRRSVFVMDVADRTLRPRISLHLGASRIDLGGTFQITQQDLVDYDLSGRINSFDLSELTRTKNQTSDISFDLQARGRAKTLETLSGTASLDFFRSSFDTAQFAGGAAKVHMNTLDGPTDTLTIASDIFDLDVKGTFSPSTVVSSVLHGITVVGDAFSRRIALLDSVRAPGVLSPPVKGPYRSQVSPVGSTSFAYTLQVKDAVPLGVLLGRKIEGGLLTKAKVEEHVDGVRMEGTMAIQGLRYADQYVTFALEGCDLAYDFDDIRKAGFPQMSAYSATGTAGLFNIEGLRVWNLAVDGSMKGDSVKYSVKGFLDSLVTVQTRGSGVYSNRLFRLDLDLLRADFRSYAFQNPEPVRLTIGRDGVRIADMLLRHDDEVFQASGIFDPVGASDLTATMRNLRVSDVPRIVRREVPGEVLPPMSGTLNATVGFQGSFEEPHFSTEISAAGVRYDDQNFGQVDFRSSYADRVLTMFAQLLSTRDSVAHSPELLVDGTIPYNLSLRGNRDEALSGEMNLDVRSNNFRLEILDPFIPELSNLSGLMVCDMKLRGTVELPSYEGSLELKKAQFMFNPLGIPYIVNGKLVPNGRQIAFDHVTVQNTPEDRPDGVVNLAGGFTLEGLRIKDFDLTANGQLLVMKEAAPRVSQGLYGDLFAGTGQEGVHWNGSPSRSFVNGELFVKYANLTLPPTRQSQDLPKSGIEVRFIDDKATEHPADTAHTSTAWSFSNNENPVPRTTKVLTPMEEVLEPPSRSFLDNIIYNLLIETQGVTQLRFIFSKLTNEQLLAELKGRTAFTKDGDQMRLTGELELGNRSYYNNYKKLDATGKVRFTGDPLNPELDVTASYEGVHRGLQDTTTTGGSSALAGSGRNAYEKVIVKVFITGTREQPKVKMGLEQYDQLGNLLPERGDVQGDAIAFLVTGAFPDEFTQQDRLSLAGSNVLGGVASSILSGPLTDLLRKEFGIVRSVDVLYYGGGTLQESADVRLTGEVGDAVFRLGGRVLSDLNNTNVSIQLPMSVVVGSEKWRNLVLEAERTVQGVETIDQRRESRGLRLLYRITF